MWRMMRALRLWTNARKINSSTNSHVLEYVSEDKSGMIGNSKINGLRFDGGRTKQHSVHRLWTWYNVS